MFDEMDIDQDGHIRQEEFEKAMNDSRLLAYFSHLQLDMDDAFGLFRLLDRNSEGSIEIDEFLDGCLRYKGDAKRLDIAKVILITEWIQHNMSTLLNVVQSTKERQELATEATVEHATH